MGSGRIFLIAAAVVAALALPAAIAAQEPAQPGGASAPSPPGSTTQSEPPEGYDDGSGDRIAARQEVSPFASASVKIVDYEFKPREIKISEGDTITWTNNGPNETHTATAQDDSFDTGEIEVGSSASVTFDKAGRFPYICTIHPSQRGTVTVAEATDDRGSRDDTRQDDGSGGTPTDDSGETDTILTPEDLAGPIPGTTDTGTEAGDLPSTGQNEIPMFLAGAALLAAGLLTGAFARFAE